MRKNLCLLAFLFGILPAIYSQTIEISGKVTDDNGKPISNASVVEKKTKKGTSTDINGNFKIKTTQGATLTISYVGFGSKDVVVGTATTIDVALKPGAGQLSEVVVTALGIKREKKALGYAVSTVGKKDLELRAEGDIGRILQGKAPGVNILSTSGLSGSGTNIIIRAINTVTGTNVTPLFVVDGVPFDASTNAQSEFEYGSQTSSRFLDLDPNNIESVSVLKGLSATTLYGQKGRNGVILITTKNGASVKVNKKLEVTLSQSFFANQVSNLPDYQNTWGGGFNLAPSFAYSNWGAAFTTPPATFPHPYDRPALALAFPEYQGKLYEYKPYNNIKDFFRTGLVSTSSISVSGNSGTASLSSSYTHLDDQGFTPGNSLKKDNFGFGGNIKLANNFVLSGAMNYVITDFVTPVTSPSFGSSAVVASIFGDVLYTPRSIDLMGLPYQNPLDGSSVYYRGGNDIQNPRWTAENALTRQKANRTYGNLKFRYELAKGFNLSYTFGMDYTNEHHVLTINKGGASGDDEYKSGVYRTTDGLRTIIDHTLYANYNKTLSSNWSLNLEGGINQRNDEYSQTGILSTHQLVFGLFNHRNFTTPSSQAEDGSSLDNGYKTKETGFFIQATPTFRDFIYLNIGGRYSINSTLEVNNNKLFYPSSSISFVPTSAFEGLKNSKNLNYWKLRAGYATSARFLDGFEYATREHYTIFAKNFIDRNGNVINAGSIPNTLPNPDLKPELEKELELGTEAKLFNNRISLDFTWYNRRSQDQIFLNPIDPATGYDQKYINGGKLRNRGIEIALGYTVVRNRKWKWQLDWNFSKNRSYVFDIPNDVKVINIAGYSNFGTVAVNGQPLGVIYADYAVHYFDDKGNDLGLLVDNNGDYVGSNDSKIIGDPTPDFKLNTISSLSYKSFTLRLQVDYTHGGQIYSGTVRTLLARGLTKDTDFDRYLPIILPGVKADGTPNDIQTSVTNAYFNDLGFGPSDRSIYDATVVRLREASLSYAFPDKWLKKTPFGSASITVSGQNLWYYAPNFPKHMNYDPEAGTSFGVGNSTGGFELLTGPSSRRFGISLKTSF